MARGRTFLGDLSRAGRRLFEGTQEIKESRRRGEAAEREERRLRVFEAAALADREEKERQRRSALEFLTNPHVQEARSLGFESPRERIRTMLDVRAEERLGREKPIEALLTPEERRRAALIGAGIEPRARAPGEGEQTPRQKSLAIREALNLAGEEAAAPFFDEAQTVADSLAARLQGGGPGAPAIDLTEEQIQRAIDEATQPIVARAESARAASTAEERQIQKLGTQTERGIVTPGPKTPLEAAKSAQDIAAQIIARELPMPSRSDERRWNKQVRARAEMWEAISSSPAFESLVALQGEQFDAEAATALREGLSYFGQGQAEGKKSFRQVIGDLIGGR